MYKILILSLVSLILIGCGQVEGPRGPQGLPGEPGPTGPQGESGVACTMYKSGKNLYLVCNDGSIQSVEL